MSKHWILGAAIAGALVLGACRHARPVAAAKPTVVPPQKSAATLPETKVASPTQEFTTPKAEDADLDPTSETLLAEQKGWIRDAFFDFDSAALRPDAEKNLDTTAQWLRNHQKYRVLIEGHCDERGTEQYNLALGEKRAYDAKAYLATLGIDPTEIATVSYGKDKPFDTGHNEEAWAKNRRAHVVLTAASR